LFCLSSKCIDPWLSNRRSGKNFATHRHERREMYHVFSCPSSRHKEGFMDRGQRVNLLVCKFSKKIEILEREDIVVERELWLSHPHAKF
jgi:hypothetical protein